MNLFSFEKRFFFFVLSVTSWENLSHKGTKSTKIILKNAIYKNVEIYFLSYEASCETVDREVLELYELILI